MLGSEAGQCDVPSLNDGCQFPGQDSDLHASGIAISRRHEVRAGLRRWESHLALAQRWQGLSDWRYFSASRGSQAALKARSRRVSSESIRQPEDFPELEGDRKFVQVETGH